MRASRLDAVKRVGLRACVLAGLLVLHWGALPLLSAPNGVNASGRTRARRHLQGDRGR